jgi:hypothetical protein
MAGMEALGRMFNVVPVASGVGLSLRHCSGVTFVCTNSAINAVFTITVAPSFGGTYVAPTSSGGIITHYYQAAAQNGSAAWTKVTQAAANAVTQATISYTTVIEVFGSELPDPNCYIKCTNSGGAGLVTAILHDLTAQRAPANLALVGA